MSYVSELRDLIGHRPLILVGSVVIIINDKNQILLQRRVDRNKWGLPGGLMELGESTEDTARREVFEETGLSLGDLHLIDIFSGKDNFVKLPNGDQFYVVATCYYTREYHGEMVIDLTESFEMQFTDIDDIPENLVGSHRRMLERFLEKNPL
jgi:ADP-ribose pyrophosphatase YjhB (NUDIX family)